MSSTKPHISISPRQFYNNSCALYLILSHFQVVLLAMSLNFAWVLYKFNNLLCFFFFFLFLVGLSKHTWSQFHVVLLAMSFKFVWFFCKLNKL